MMTTAEVAQIWTSLKDLPHSLEVALIQPKLFPSDPETPTNWLLFHNIWDYIRHLEATVKPGDLWVRFRSKGLPLSKELLEKSIQQHLYRGMDYTFADGGRICLFDLSYEIIRTTPSLRQSLSIFPDNSIDLGLSARKDNYLFDENDLRFYLHDHYRKIYSRPRSLTLEVTTRCNAKCKRCFYYAPENEDGLFGDKTTLMSTQDFRTLVDRIYELYGNYPDLELCGRGEPLLNPSISELINYAKLLGFRCSLTTNGSLLKDAAGEKLLDSGLDSLMVSIDAASEKVYNRLRSGISFIHLTHNLETFLNLRNKRNGHGNRAQLGVKMIVQPENTGEIDAFLENWRCRADHVVLWDGYNAIAQKIGHPHSTNAYNGHPLCVAYWGNLYIAMDGRIYPCCLICSKQAYENPLGNIADSEDVWNAPLMTEVRRRKLAGENNAYPFCTGCQYPCIPAVLEKRRDGDGFITKTYNMTDLRRLG